MAQPVIAEIEYGLARLPRSVRRDRLRQRFEIFKAELIRVDRTDRVSQAFGDIKAALAARGIRLEDLDVAMAAHARAVEATIVTDNVAQMSRVPGLPIENWRA